MCVQCVWVKWWTGRTEKQQKGNRQNLVTSLSVEAHDWSVQGHYWLIGGAENGEKLVSHWKHKLTLGSSPSGFLKLLQCSVQKDSGSLCRSADLRLSSETGTQPENCWVWPTCSESASFIQIIFSACWVFSSVPQRVHMYDARVSSTNNKNQSIKKI